MSPVVGLIPANSPLPTQVIPRVVHHVPGPTSRYGWQMITVRNGDNLSDLAITYRSTVGSLIARNRLRNDGHLIAVGARLSVPRTTPAPRRVVVPRYATYVVRSGDNLGAIAARYKVSLATLYSLNRISRTAYLQPGQRIRVPAPAARARAKARAVAAVSTTIVTVRSGDTLGGIALRHRVSLASLLKANRLSTRSVLQIGQRLKVVTPARASAYSGNTFAGRTYSNKVVSAASANRAYLAHHLVPSRLQVRAMIVATARRHGVDPKLALAVSWQESGWNQHLVSVANAIGAMQVIPSTGAWASELVGRRLNLLNAQDNVTAGVVVLRSLTRSARTQNEAIAGYYQGLYSVQKHGMYADTKRYVASILLIKRQM